MSLFAYFFGCFILCTVILLLCISGLGQSSLEVERFLNMVKSQRPDVRRIGFSERLRAGFLRESRNLRRLVGAGQDNDLSRRLAEAGFRGTHPVEFYFGTQAIGLLSGGVLGSFASADTFFWILAGAVVGFMVPDLWLARKQKSRRDRIRRGLADMVDLLVVCVSAGLGLDQALLRVGEELSISHPAVAMELERVSLERQAGAPRLEAWKALAARNRIEELTSFTNMLIETDRFGTPITKALSEFSEDLRTRRRQRAEEAAAKTKVKIIFPLVLCIFPCIFIVLLAPALISLAKGFTLMGR